MKLSKYSKFTLVIAVLFVTASPITEKRFKQVDLTPRKQVKTIETIAQRPIKLYEPKLPELIQAMIIVESDGRDHVIGDKHLGKNYAAGALQIRPVMVREVNRILKLQHKQKRYKLKDRFSRQKSIEMFNIWRQFHHPDDDFEKIARNWNGGPKGYLKNSTVDYWVEVQMELNK